MFENVRHKTEWATALSILISYTSVYLLSIFLVPDEGVEAMEKFISYSSQFRNIIYPSAAAIAAAAASFMKKNVFQEDVDLVEHAYTLPGTVILIGAPIIFALVLSFVYVAGMSSEDPEECLLWVTTVTSMFSGFYVLIALEAFKIKDAPRA
tara:strand:- start:1678 stop:2133 length:456 start_codon:yes stop_codon:yes gene_type:complete